MKNVCDYMACTGCGACANVCPAACIDMLPDQEGFLRPYIKETACIGCNRCVNVCPNNNPVQTYAESVFYYGWNTRQEVREKSSSGGFFTALSEYVIDRGGVVFGVLKEHESNVLLFHYAQTLDEIAQFRFSKYYQAEMRAVYDKVKSFLNDGRMVLFTGTGCQIAGILNYLKNHKNLDLLITADCLCHGTPSKLAVDLYLQDKEKEKNKAVVDFKFRVKPDDCRWSEGGSARMKLFFDDSTSEVLNPVIDTYFTAFGDNLILRESCYKCRYCGVNRISDFTMADYWGVNNVEKEHLQYGVSLVLCNSEIANAIMPELTDFYFDYADKEVAVANNLALIRPNTRPGHRSGIYKRFIRYGFDRTIQWIYKKKYFLFFVKKCIGYKNIQRLKRFRR